MFPTFKRLLGNITLEKKGNVFVLEGIPKDVYYKDIGKLWGTTRIEQHMFIGARSSSMLMFHEFFLVDVYYAFQKLLNDDKASTSKRTISRIIELLLTQTRLVYRDTVFPTRLDRSKLNLLKLAPLLHQDGFFEAYDQNTQRGELNGMLHNAAAGAGKTYSAIALMTMLEKDVVIVVCPNNALERVWKTTLETCFHKPQTVWVNKFSGPFTGKEKWFVINGEYLPQLVKDLSHIPAKNIGIILDESHEYNDPNSVRVTSFIELCEKTKSKDIVFQSGSPVKAIGAELIPLIRCLDPQFDAQCQEAFKKIFGLQSSRALDILNNRLNTMTFKVEKAELNLNRPAMRQLKIAIKDGHRFTLDNVRKEMSRFVEERQAYYDSRRQQDQMEYDRCLKTYQASISDSQSLTNFQYYKDCVKFIQKNRGDARVCKTEMIYCNAFEKRQILPTLHGDDKKLFMDTKSIIKYTHLKIQGECLGRVVGGMRSEMYSTMAKEIDYIAVIESSVKKTLIFASHVAVLDAVRTKLLELGLTPLGVYGKDTTSLSATVAEFEKNVDANPLIATYKSLSTAVPLVMADRMILVDPPWRDYILQQTISRINRIGETSASQVYICGLDTGEAQNLSDRTVDILRWSQQSVAAITGVSSPYELGDDLDNVELALEEMGTVEKTPKPQYLSW